MTDADADVKLTTRSVTLTILLCKQEKKYVTNCVIGHQSRDQWYISVTIHRPELNSADFHENLEIPQKRSSAQDSVFRRKLPSLVMMMLQHRLHGNVYLTMSVTAKVTPIFIQTQNSELAILTLHAMTYHLLVVLFNYTLYNNNNNNTQTISNVP